MVVTLATNWARVFVVGNSDHSSRFITPQRFSMGLRSGDCGGHLRTWMLSWARNSLTSLDVWHGALSCMNVTVVLDDLIFGKRLFLINSNKFLNLNFHLCNVTKGPKPDFEKQPQNMTPNLPLWYTLLRFGRDLISVSSLQTMLSQIANSIRFLRLTSDNMTFFVNLTRKPKITRIPEIHTSQPSYGPARGNCPPKRARISAGIFE